MLVLWAGVLLLMSVWSITLGDARQEEAQASRASLQATERLLDTYEAQTLRVLNEVTQNLRLVAYATRFAGENGRLAELQKSNLLMPNLLFTTRLVARDGTLLASSRATAEPSPVLGELLSHHATSRQVFVSKPYALRPGGEAVIDISRSVDERPDSEIVIVTMPASYLVSDYDQGRFGAAGVLAVVGQDGVFRAKRTGDRITSGESTDFRALVPQDTETEGAASLRSSAWDGVSRYTSARRLYGYPLAVVVGLSEDERLQPARQIARARVYRSWLISAAAVLVTLTLSLLLKRIQTLGAREREAQIRHTRSVEHMAYHDALTGLPNRAHFGRRLAECLAEGKSRNSSFALMLIDLDGFKKVNDVQGHQAGDQLLIEVAARLNHCVRTEDFVARLGGDEFVILLPIRQGRQEIDAVAQRLIHTVGQPFDLGGISTTVTASVGVALHPEDGMDEDTLTRHADEAMYSVKVSGKNAVQYSAKLAAGARESALC